MNLEKFQVYNAFLKHLDAKTEQNSNVTRSLRYQLIQNLTKFEVFKFSHTTNEHKAQNALLKKSERAFQQKPCEVWMPQ